MMLYMLYDVVADVVAVYELKEAWDVFSAIEYVLLTNRSNGYYYGVCSYIQLCACHPSVLPVIVFMHFLFKLHHFKFKLRQL